MSFFAVFSFSSTKSENRRAEQGEGLVPVGWGEVAGKRDRR
jgi:hypothetical protein